MDEIYARSENSDGEKETLEHHLLRTSELCGEFLAPIGLEEAGKAMGLLHDFGKYGKLFQRVLTGEEHRVNHAAPGAAIARGYIQDKDGKSIQPIQAAICYHHDDLQHGIPQTVQNGDIVCGKGSRIDASEAGKRYSIFGLDEFRYAKELFDKIMPQKKYTVHLPQFDTSGEGHIEEMLFYRILASALTDADFSSSAEHFEKNYLLTHTGPPLDCADAQKRLDTLARKKRAGSTANLELNQLRERLSQNCAKAAEGAPGLYTLTAPTGLGKTMALMRFAVAHAKKYGMRRIILVAPYLSIIDQNTKDYEEIISALLESHGNARLSDTNRYLSERWAAPCVVTSNVGFLEPLFSNKRTDLRHLHELAQSVIVLDEAQSLPSKLLYATLTTLKCLCTEYGCTVVLSTATQPSYNWLPDFSWEPTEIVQTPQQLFEKTKRVEYEWRMDQKHPASFNAIAEEMSEDEQVMTIVNMKAHAKELLYSLKNLVGEEGTYFVSSDLCVAHRTRVIEEIKERLNTGQPCRVVSTQCVEAGVDLDFPVVYRALAPLESIIQAAGRCNRNAKYEKGKVVVFIPEKEKYPVGDGYYGSAANKVKVLYNKHKDNIDCNDLSLIDEYYKLVFQYSDGDKDQLKRAIKDFDFHAVAKQYKLIANEGMAQVIVPFAGERELYEAIREEYDKNGLSTRIMAMARTITVSTYDIDLLKQCASPMYFKQYEANTDETGFWLMGDDRYYNDITGFSAPEGPIVSIF